jgi:hypothetical protein
MIKAVDKLNELSYKDRLIEEYLVLENRIALLYTFIKSTKFKEFTFKYKHYMRMLYSSMRHYLKYLKKRMDYLNIDKPAIDAYIKEDNAKAVILKEHLNNIEKRISTKDKKSKPKKEKKNAENK